MPEVCRSDDECDKMIGSWILIRSPPGYQNLDVVDTLKQHVTSRQTNRTPPNPVGIAKHNALVSVERVKRLNWIAHRSNTWTIWLAFCFALCASLGILLWVIYRVTKPKKTRRGSHSGASRKTNRDQIAQFYQRKASGTALVPETLPKLTKSERHSISTGIGLGREKKMLNTCISRPARFPSGGNSCSAFGRAPRVQFLVTSPPVSIGVPQPIQPRGSAQSECLFTSRGTEKSDLYKRRYTTGELSYTLLSKVGYSLNLTGQSTTSDSGRSTPSQGKSFKSTSSLLLRHNAVDIRDAGWTRSNSCIRSGRLSLSDDYGSNNSRQLRSVQGRHSMGEAESAWTQLSSSIYGKSRISFTLSYVCTTGILTVTVNRLNGVHLITNSTRLLPSQTETAFVVAVRLNQRKSQPNPIGPDPCPSNVISTSPQSTHSVSSSLNPVFDQSFTFKLSLNEIETSAIQFTVYRTTMEPLSGKQLVLRRRASLRSQSHQIMQRQLTHERARCGETVCLGSAYYPLNRDDLVNRPERLRELWRDIQRDLDSDEEEDANVVVGAETKLSETGSELTSADERRKSTGGVIRQSSSLRSIARNAEKTTMELSMQYDRVTLQLIICLKDARNVRLQRKDACIFVRTVLYKGDKILATARSSLIKTGLSPLCDWDRKKESNSCMHTSSLVRSRTVSDPFPRGERIEFPIDMNRLIESNTLGLILFLCSRSRFGQGRLVGQCAIGASGFTEGDGTHLWDQLVDAVRKLKEDETDQATSTPVFASWQTVTSLTG
ncbi:unnamed protein product [Echinostoma caproni]|uniref:C2 domain-containing protein n=1 Tax=Echinostoma caproni TaxID=27848 RepID=A0A183A825_9TREM|nr:unnamed protein product [Echinostoma caproni]